jgi:integrase
MAPVDLPFLQFYRARGKLYAYYRRNGQHIRLRGEPGTPEFLAAYDAARRAVEVGGKPRRGLDAPVLPGSFRALVDLYRGSPEYRTLVAGSRSAYDRLIAPMADKYGDLMVADIPRAWVLMMRDELQATPRTANYRLAVIRRLLSFAVDREWRADNPAQRIRLLRTGPGHRVWTDAEIEALTGPQAGDVAIPVLLGLHTGQRQGDILRLPWTAWQGGYITLRQSKTQQELSIKVSAELAEILEQERARQQANKVTSLVICVTASGTAWKSDWFKHRFAQVREKLGMPNDLHFHGLRHSVASRLAEAGASDAEIQAVTGHKTRAMVARYTQGARQKSLAEAAVARLPTRRANKHGTEVSNAPETEVSNASPGPKK